MRCPECDHENTEGAWLCINCGEKLPRPETEATGDEPVADVGASRSEPDEPSRFAPQISENLRRLRDQTERDRARTRIRGGVAAGRSAMLGIPVAAWALIAFVFIVFVIIVSSVQ